MTKLTRKRLEIIREGLERGLTRSKIAEAAGVDRVTLWRWIQKANDPENTQPIYLDLRRTLKYTDDLHFEEGVAVIAKSGSSKQTTITKRDRIIERFVDGEFVKDSRITERVEVISPPSWRATARALELRFHERLNRRQLAHTGEIGDGVMRVVFDTIPTGKNRLKDDEDVDSDSEQD